MAGRRWAQHQLSQVMVGRPAGVVAPVATGEEAFDDAFEAGRTLGQRLDVLAEVGQITSA